MRYELVSARVRRPAQPQRRRALNSGSTRSWDTLAPRLDAMLKSSRWFRRGLGWIAALSLLLPVIAQQATPAHAAAAPPSVTDTRLFAGVNVPWFNWACDFGCGTGKGVSSPAS